MSHAGVGSPDVRRVDAAVTVQWFASSVPADEGLRTHVGHVVGVAPAAVRVGRVCGRCGSTTHGRPWAGHGVHVSLARSGPHLVTAVSTAGPIGVDVESIADVERAWDDLTPVLELGVSVTGSDRAASWCRLEATLKREGTGFGPHPDLGRLADGVIVDLVCPTGYRAALAYSSR